jgi:S1-C subfamily serine protease
VQCKSNSSGGPAINDNGEVIGIVSRSDALEDDRCYLAPARPLHQLLKKAKAKAKAKRSKGKPEARVRFNSTLDSCAMQK